MLTNRKLARLRPAHFFLDEIPASWYYNEAVRRCGGMADTRDLKSLGVTTVRVRAPPPAPNLGTTYDTKTVIQIGWLFLYMARKPLKTLGFSALRMPRQPLRSPVFHSGVWAAEMAEKSAAGLHPFGNEQGCAAWPSPTKSALREKVKLFRGGRFFIYRMVKASRSSVSV